MSSARMSGPVDDALVLQRWGTRFARADVEQQFREWHFERAAPRYRAVVGAAFGLWTAMSIALLVSDLQRVTETLAIFGVVYLALGIAGVALQRRDATMFRRTVLAANLASGVAGVVAPYMHDIDAGAIVVVSGSFGCFFILTGTAGQGLSVSFPGALVMIAGAEAARVERWLHGDLGGIGLAVESVLLWMSLLVGTVVGLGVERAEHTAYRQEKTIEAQRETIAKQQALLEKELSHQVAERSRELGAVLARSDVTLDVRALKAGERFAERYRIERALGAGGMGAVYEVERVTDGARLALKAVVGEVSGASAARFAREAEIGARVRHPNVVSIVDVGVSGGVPYLVMELVRGGSLDSQRARFGDVAWALPVLRQIAEGLSALHEAGVVHRDLKPANVLLTESGAKISDFGISRFGAIEDSGVDARADTMAATPKQAAELTGTGVVMGTPLYMAPEGARSARALDASADVFALGILAYEMLTGRAPFAVPPFVLAMADQPIPRPPPIEDARVPAGLRSAVSAALAGDPAARPRARAFLAAPA